MTVAEMVERLKALPQDLIVMAYDADSEALEDVTGFLVCASVLEIQTDDNT